MAAIVESELKGLGNLDIHEKTFSIQTSDGETFKVPASLVKISGIFQIMNNDCEDSPDNDTITLSNVDSTNFMSLIKFSEIYDRIRMKPVPSVVDDIFENLVHEEYIKFIKGIEDCKGIDSDKLAHLMNSAEFLDIQSLLDLLRTYYACEMRKLSPESMMKKFKDLLKDHNS